jgi:glycerol-1-phosphate dehydrogenase [NAD(P)+]
MLHTRHALPRIEVCTLSTLDDRRAAMLVTDDGAWNALGGMLKLQTCAVAKPIDASLEQFEAIAADVPAEAQVIYAVGGGLPVDAAKMASLRSGLPLIAVPTALSVDAHLTPASGVRRDGCVFYVETAAPNVLYVDWDVIAAAPNWIRAAGICDVLSIATGLWDWRFAENAGRNQPGQHWIPYAATIARTLFDESLAIAESAGRGEVLGMTRLLELLALEVQLCSLIGHSRPEEGSEHAFAYAVENLVGKGLPHGDLVGPGILAIAAAQGQDVEPLRKALLASGARLDRIPADIAKTTLRELPAFAGKHGLPYGIAHELDEKKLEAAINAVWRA